MWVVSSINEKGKGVIMGIVFGLMGVGLLVGACAMGSSVAIFIDIPSCMIVLGGTVLFSFAYQSPGAIRGAFAAALGTGEVGHAEGVRHLAALRTVRVCAVATGLLGMLIGLVSMLAQMDDPSSVGPAMAVALLTSLYSVLLAELFVAPLMIRLQGRVGSEKEHPGASVGPSMLAIVVPGVALFSFA